ncbi:protein kinase [Burkholderia seminalis]|uniref:serine/threonine protein kinase n=1 Tax=Burkholderia seminalis TaxID=488731 RepID=UPI001CF59BA3|nr:protein kinase [Burkholderia seminalis]MCA8425838.1 protein kinase [Burkholderia seminalis]
MTLGGLWVDAGKYKERWEIVQQGIGEGGQGTGHLARRISDGASAFIKVIKDNASSERRARFYEEAKAYEKLVGGQTPQLIESNAHFCHDKNRELYIATEYIKGPTMRQWRAEVRAVSIPKAIEITLSLLDTVRQIHAAGVIHRDIKPENIIMQEGYPSRPVLLDFGMAFHAERSSQKSLTKDGSEVGNRFLRLPEFTAGSEEKRTVQSDLTFVAGVLFFLLVGRNPAQLQDHYNLLPHQRVWVLNLFEQIDGLEKSRLKNFFDRAFPVEIKKRFQSAGEMVAALNQVLELYGKPEATDAMGRLNSLLGENTLKNKQERREHVEKALDWAFGAYSGVSKRSRGYVSAWHVHRNVKEGHGFIRIRWDRDGEYFMCSYLWLEAVGGQFVWYVADDEVCRCAIELERDQEYLRKTIGLAVEKQLLDILKPGYGHLAPEFEFLHAVRGKFARSWYKAQKLSVTCCLPVFAIFYDPTQSMAGIEHVLDTAFCENETKAALQRSFVLLVAQRSEVPAHLTLPQFSVVWGVLQGGTWREGGELVANSVTSGKLIKRLATTYSSEVK